MTVEDNLALLIVDLQNDFCSGGALHVPDGDRIVGPVNRISLRFAAAGAAVFASRDWHPKVTRHFRQYGGLWPEHCVQGSPGSQFHPALQMPRGAVLLYKGTDPERDAYSAFDAVTEDGSGLKGMLDSLGVSRLCICGLATDYCVKSTVLDALKSGLAVTVLSDAVAGVDLAPGDSARALEEMRKEGASICTVDELIGTFFI